MVLRTALLCFLLTLQLALNSHAVDLEAPTGTVILTVSGAIAVNNSQENAQGNAQGNADNPKSAQFDQAMLEKIGMTQVNTETPWTDGLVAFEGVLVRDLLELVKAEGNSVRASALDNYSVDIPIEDFLKYDVIIATRINGKTLRVRDNGPLWIIYPWTDNSKLKRPHFFARSIWQLHSLTIN